MISTRPIQRAGVIGVPMMMNANSVVHSGSEPGINTEACVAGANKNPLYARVAYITPAIMPINAVKPNE